MPICSYLILPVEGAVETLTDHLAALPGCEVLRAENRDLLILVTDTSGPEEDDALHDLLAQRESIQALLLTFGELDPQAPGDPRAIVWRKGRRLPVLEPQGSGWLVPRAYSAFGREP